MIGLFLKFRPNTSFVPFLMIGIIIKFFFFYCLKICLGERKKGQSEGSSIESKFKHTKRGQDSTNKEDQKVHVMGTRILPC